MQNYFSKFLKAKSSAVDLTQSFVPKRASPLSFGDLHFVLVALMTMDNSSVFT